MFTSSSSSLLFCILQKLIAPLSCSRTITHACRSHRTVHCVLQSSELFAYLNRVSFKRYSVSEYFESRWEKVVCIPILCHFGWLLVALIRRAGACSESAPQSSHCNWSQYENDAFIKVLVLI